MADPRKKRFALGPSSFEPLAEGRGSCLATDRVTVDGKPVGFMYRELPDNDMDSGWRFFSDEDAQEYANDPDNFALYDVNTIANCDPDIIEYLDAPAFSDFQAD